MRARHPATLRQPRAWGWRCALAHLVLLCCLAPAPAFATMRALLVGVSEYPTLAANYQLRGPRNDVQRLRQLLAQRGFLQTNIEVLADGVDGAALPTRNNIIAALDGLAKTAQPGDLVLLAFGGHGSQQPADRSVPSGRDKPDGLNEIFLPRDIGAWGEAGSPRKVRNAIVDYELRAEVDAILARGAFVWGIFDTCHAATLVRSGEQTTAKMRYRHVVPQDLGIPESALASAQARDPSSAAASTRGIAGAEAQREAGGTGRSVFFYATQTNELSAELNLPLGAANAQVHGLFSHTVTRLLEQGRPMTYRQMAQAILAEYGSMLEIDATPAFTGTGLDTPVLGQTAAFVRQWPLDIGPPPSLPVGSLSGIGEAALFTIEPSAVAGPGEAIGYAVARHVQPASTELTTIENAGKPALRSSELRAANVARLVEASSGYALRVTVDTSDCGARCALRKTVDALAAHGVPGTDLRWVDAADGADIAIKLRPDRIAFLSPTQQQRAGCAGADTTPACGVGSAGSGVLGFKVMPADEAATTTRLAESLHAIARATNLMRIASDTATRPPSAGVTAGLNLEPAHGMPQPVAAGTVPTLHAGDHLRLVLRNPGALAQDVTVLWLDANDGITPLFPNAGGASNRLAQNDETASMDIRIDAETRGLERLMVFTVTARKNAEAVDLSFLAQPPLQALRTRSAGPVDDDIQAFWDAAFADHAARGEKGLSQRIGMQVFSFKVER